MQGKMIFFNEAENYGFIRTEEDERLLVRRTGFVDAAPVGRCGGLDVEFTVQESGGEREAVNVMLVPDDSRGRARRRQSGMRLR
jgi:cold shock CspA family protein